MVEFDMLYEVHIAMPNKFKKGIFTWEMRLSFMVLCFLMKFSHGKGQVRMEKAKFACPCQHDQKDALCKFLEAIWHNSYQFTHPCDIGSSHVRFDCT